MALAGALEIQIFAEIARLRSDMQQATGVVKTSMSSIESAVGSAKTALASLGISLGAAYFVTLIKGSIEAQAHLEELTKSTALTVTELAGLSMIAKQSGTDLDGLAKAVDKMSVAIGKDPEKFAALGVTAKDNAGAFKQLSDIFNSLTDVQQRNAVAQTVFGKSWAEVAPVLAMGSAKIGELMDKSAALNPNIEENARLAKGLKDSWSELGSAMEATRREMVANTYPALIQITGAVTQAYKESGLLMAAWVALGGVGNEIFKFFGVLITGVTIDLQEMNLAVMKFFRAPDADIKALEARIASLNKSIVDMTNVPKLEATHPLVDPAVAAAAAARAAAFLGQAKAAADLSKELEKLLAIDLKNLIATTGAELDASDQFYKDTAALAEQNSKLRQQLNADDLKSWMETVDAIVAEDERSTKAIADNQIALADARSKANQKAMDDIARAEKQLVDQLDHDAKQGFDKMFQKLGGGWQAFLESMAMSFKRLVADAIYAYFAKPFVLNIIAGVAGMMGATGVANAATSAAGTASNVFSGVGSLSNLFTGGGAVGNAALQLGSATGSAMISNFALGMQSATLAEAGVYGLAGQVGYAIPYVGWVLAAYAAYKAFFDKPEMKQGWGQAGISTSGTIDTGAGGIHGGFDPTSVTNLAAQSVQQFANIVQALGGTISQRFGIGIGQGSGGQFNVVTNIGSTQGRDASGLTNEAAQIAATQAIVTGLQQAADFPEYIHKVFAAINAATADAQTLTDAIAFAGTLRGIHDALTETRAPMQILTDSAADLESKLHTSGATFKTDFLAAIDAGITPAALANWQQLAAILDNINATNAQIAQQRGSLQEQLDVLTGSRTQQQIDRQHQLAQALDPANAALMQQIFAQQDLAAANAAATAASEAAAAAAREQAAAEAELAGFYSHRDSVVSQSVSAAAKLIVAQNMVNAVMAQFGATVRPTTDQFLIWIMSLPTATKAQRDLVNSMLDLIPALNLVNDAANRVSGGLSGTNGRQGGASAGRGGSGGAGGRGLVGAIDAVGDAALQAVGSLWQATDMRAQEAAQAKEAADAAKAAADATQKYLDAQTALTAWLNSNALSDLSPMTAQQKEAEALRQYQATLGLARAGDLGAMADLTKAADALLAADKLVEGFGGGYSALYAQIRQDIANIANSPAPGQANPFPTWFGNSSPVVTGIFSLKAEVSDMKTVMARLLEKGNEIAQDGTEQVVSSIFDSAQKNSGATAFAALADKTA